MRPESVLVALALCTACGSAPTRPATPHALSFWDTPRHGANFFHEGLDARRFDAARGYGMDVVRLSISELPHAGHDFLLGDADHYTQLVPEDLAILREALDMAAAADLGVVVTTLSLPGARWRQHNGDASDGRLYRDLAFHAEAAAFWRDLAMAIGGHPALVGYDLLNEPFPDEVGDCAARRGTAADLDVLYARLVPAIREVDAQTPIVIEPADYGSARALDCLTPIDDPRVLYTVHLYEPWELTTWRRNPGRVVYGGPGWDRATLEAALAPFAAWADAHHVPASRLFLSEVGIDRRIPNAGMYLADALDIANARGWHWAFYAFREDDWDGMDYELGSAPTDDALRATLRAGDDAAGARRVQSPFDAIVRALAR